MVLQPWFRAIAVVAVVGGFGIVLAARQSRGADPPGSMSDLTNEVRLLRQAVEKGTQNQSQVQAMAVYLSAQQNRLNQSSARADALRRELESLNRRPSEISRQLGELERLLSSGVLNSTPQGRANIQEQVEGLRAEMQRLPAEQARIGGRVAEADAAVSGDLARWTEMITRLDQLTRQ
jgi:chromosome segregation ATPase